MTVVLPGLGLTGGWADGESGWGADLNFALLALSSLAGKALDSITDSLPGVVPEGTVMVDTTVGPTEGFIAIGSGGVWSYVTPEFGWTFYVRDAARFATFTADGWVWTPISAIAPFGPSDAGKVLTVSAGGDDTEWLDPGAATGALPDIAGNFGKVLEVIGSGVGSESGVAWRRPGRMDIMFLTAAYTLQDEDIGKYLRVTAAAEVAITVPLFTTEAIPEGSTFVIRQGGAGQVVLVAEGGVTLRTNATLKTRVQESTISLTKTNDNSWDVTGDLEQIP